MSELVVIPFLNEGHWFVKVVMFFDKLKKKWWFCK